MFVEFALLVPILTILAMGIVEYGMGWKWANDVNAAARDAARSATSEPVFLTSDRAALLSIATSLTSEQIDNIEQIIVFAPIDSKGSMYSSCKSKTNTTGSSSSAGSRSGVSNYCNVYGKGQLRYVLAHPSENGPWLNSSGTGCDSSDLSSYWCPASRKRSLTTGTFSTLGVSIKMKKPSMTNMGFGDFTITRTAVFRLEPAFGGS